MIRLLKRIFILFPVEVICKVIEKIGITYGILWEYPFQKGKRKAQGVYRGLEK